jgi:very-short-patch-repair endonuclease
VSNKNALLDIKSRMCVEHRLKGGWHVPHVTDQAIDRLNLKELWVSYKKIISLRCERFDWECVRTHEEMEFLEKYKLHFKWKIYPGLFIGPHQVDFFIPQLNTTIEIGGGIYFDQRKVRLEAQKLEAISRELGFAQAFFWNKDVSYNFSKVIRTLSGLTAVDSSMARINLKRALWSTIAYGATRKVLYSGNRKRPANQKVSTIEIEGKSSSTAGGGLK